jgi:hypothetical protein
MEGMENTPRSTTRTIDLTGLPEEAIRAMESLVSLLRKQTATLGGTHTFASREEWIQAIRAWSASYTPQGSNADWSRESIYADPDE